jgi:MGT family glycosyltransferase
MTRFLFATYSATGHVAPFEPVARELVARGHEVDWYTGERHRDRLLAAGATPVIVRRAATVDAAELDARLPDRAGRTGLDLLRFDVRNVFLAPIPGQVADLQAHLAHRPADVLLADHALSPAALILEERLGLPWASLGVTALMVAGHDLAPFGLGLAPARGVAGRLRNRVLGATVRRVVHAGLDREYHAIRARLGALPIAEGLFDFNPPHLHLQPTVPSFEYPRRAMPQSVRFVGPLLPAAPQGFRLPSWWGELGSGHPVVVVTQGTVATDPEDLLLPALRALAKEDVLTIGVTGGSDPAELGPLPANARVERFVPFAELLPHASALVTNGGYGGLQFALAHGVPLVAAGATEEKPELVARVSWCGAGVGIRAKRPGAQRLRQAVRAVLDDPAYGARALAIAAEMAAHDAPAEAADALEALGSRTRGDLAPLQ